MSVWGAILLVIGVSLVLIVTFGIVWSLSTISLYIGIPIGILLAVFFVFLILKVAGRD